MTVSYLTCSYLYFYIQRVTACSLCTFPLPGYEQCGGLSDVVDALSLQTFKVRLDNALGNLI